LFKFWKFVDLQQEKMKNNILPLPGRLKRDFCFSLIESILSEERFHHEYVNEFIRKLRENARCLGVQK